MGVEVRHEPERDRYLLLLDGEPAGRLEYGDREGALVLFHTEVDPRFGGRGLGGQLVAAALADIRERGQRVVPTCSFVAAYLQDHPELADLVAS